MLRACLRTVRAFTRLRAGDAASAQDNPSGTALVRAERVEVGHLPAVGLLVGMAACVAFAVVSLMLPVVPLAPFAAAIASTAVTVLLTGALHERGLVDLVDSIDGSGAGAMPMLALLFAVGAKCALLAVLAAQSPGGVLASLLAAHAVSRFAPLPMASVIAPEAGRWPVPALVARRSLWIAGLWCVPALLLLGVAGGGGSVAGALLFSGAAVAAWRHFLLRRHVQVRGGEGFGATQQVGELAFYLGAAMAMQPQ
ncbi:adenosylcobinamide-GDP ribazoletransferase [Ramlibacter sp.]|uniref:adenosylcobinamide-GDP ribazoletransferase n=1 Tax=Ramlibacter sp. TaxID=1917967 RepID=UPI003D0E5912